MDINHYLHFSWNALLKPGSRSDNSLMARNRFRLRTFLASFLFLVLLGGLIHLINLARRPSPSIHAIHVNHDISKKK